MDLASVPFFSILRGKLGWLAQRQNVLAENVANADTPGFVPRDLKAPSFADLMERGGAAKMARTEPGHLTPKGSAHGEFEAVRAPDRAMSEGGSAVSLEDQMMKVSETAMDYQSAINLYGKGINLIRLAIRGSGR